jgi:hypothetical protein
MAWLTMGFADYGLAVGWSKARPAMVWPLAVLNILWAGHDLFWQKARLTMGWAGHGLSWSLSRLEMVLLAMVCAGHVLGWPWAGLLCPQAGLTMVWAGHGMALQGLA